jgi:hypothetical protein
MTQTKIGERERDGGRPDVHDRKGLFESDGLHANKRLALLNAWARAQEGGSTKCLGEALVKAGGLQCEVRLK